MYCGIELAGGALAPPLDVQFVPHVGLVDEFSNPLKEDGAAPPDNLFVLDHWLPHHVTFEPTAALPSPIANAPPFGKA
jgi:hypothetical protein